MYEKELELFLRASPGMKFVTVGTTDVQLLEQDLNRIAICVGCPPLTDTPVVSDDTLVSAASTAATGVKASYTVPAGVQAVLTSATVVETTGTGVVSNLQLVRAATTYNLGQVTTTGVFLGTVTLQAGDVVQWNVTTAVAASVCDYTIQVERERVPPRVTLALGQVAVLDQGINMYGSQYPFFISRRDFGQLVTMPLHAISSLAGQIVGVWTASAAPE